MSTSFTTVSVGAIGDVKYSVLEPDKFTRENGDGWVLMDGREIRGTDLWRLTGMEKLPDARGVFIRGMNIGRDHGNGDADGDRQVGSSQNDLFKDHSHQFACSGDTNAAAGNARTEIGWGLRTTSGASGGGSETRPRNIALYTYIKVSNPKEELGETES